MSEIASQQRQLQSALESCGWRVVERSNDMDSWRDQELWLLRSIWRPTTVQVYLVFQLFPFIPMPKPPKGQGDWSVQCTDTYPVDSKTRTIADVSLTHWDKNLTELMNRLGQYRDQVTVADDDLTHDNRG